MRDDAEKILPPCTNRLLGADVLMELTMRAGQKVRLKATSPLMERLDLPAEALGAVICCYQLLRGVGGAPRVDVRFGPGLVVWGAPGDQFETVEDELAA